ncbi:MAG: carboxyl-terminal processing protease [Solirubrobacterales bacterium]|nr:carboxyl-terminal processing protease [Solirubrobacterales bacterium]
MTRPKLAVAAVVLVAFVVGIVAGGQVDAIRNGVNDVFGNKSQDATAQAIDVIHDDYFHTTDSKDLENASIGSIIAHIKQRYHDRFSHYFNPSEYDRFRQGSSLSGVGIAVNEVARGLRVATVYKHTPARDAGIQQGEVITAVNGSSIAGKDANAVTGQIRGPAGTKVTLTIASRDGTSRDVTLTRREVEIPQVVGRIEKVHGVDVGYVRLAGFFPGAHGELRNEVEHLYQRGAQGLILDLRGNGGGLLTEAVLVSSIFVPNGVIVSTHGRTQHTRTFDATGDALPRHPMAVLINGDTASASEIVTAALEQAGIAKVVGTTSFGKGTFQEVIPLKNGGALDLTVGEYLTRNGTSINGIGITPQVRAKDIPSTKPDEGLQRALQVLGQQL